MQISPFVDALKKCQIFAMFFCAEDCAKEAKTFHILATLLLVHIVSAWLMMGLGSSS
jgi:hypothetical protein